MNKNIVLLTGRAGSKSIIKKNTYPVLGRPLTYYPMYMATQAKRVDNIYVTTDCPDIGKVAKELGITVIDRPKELSEDHSELPDAIIHAMGKIKEEINYLISMHCNCAVHRPGLIDECIVKMDENPNADSCVSGYVDQSVHPFRTKQILDNGHLATWLEVPKDTSNNRQNLSPCFILDGAVRVIRVEKCFPAHGQPPFSYLGNRILHEKNISGGDVHSIGEIPQVESRLRELGWTEGASPDKSIV